MNTPTVTKKKLITPTAPIKKPINVEMLDLTMDENIPQTEAEIALIHAEEHIQRFGYLVNAANERKEEDDYVANQMITFDKKTGKIAPAQGRKWKIK